eukprot:scaffold110233_cov34-Prasinocladus_malaysianus.AAC.1
MVSEHIIDTHRLAQDAFYAPMVPDSKSKWVSWLRKWRGALSEAHGGSKAMEDVAADMRLVNPKYIPREWMLVEASPSWELSDMKSC